MRYGVKCFPHHIICGILDVGGLLSGKECPNGHEGFIDVIKCLSVGVPALGLRRIGLVVVEIWGELFLPLNSIFCGILDVWAC